MKPPTYRRHSTRDRAFVEFQGSREYLPGPFGSDESRAAYRAFLRERVYCEPETHRSKTIHGMMTAYLRHVRATQGDREVSHTKNILRLLAKHGGASPSEFTPKMLKKVMADMAEKELSRRYINAMAGRIRRMFSWAVSEELCPAAVHVALSTVKGLKKNRTKAKELPAVQPVSFEVVNATLPYLQPIVAAMVRIQRLTACRPGELTRLTPGIIDRSKPVWEARFAEHKTQHHGHARTVFIGPQAQALLLPFLDRAPDAYCFSPQEVDAAWRISRRKPTTQVRKRKKENPKRKPGLRYRVDSYSHAIDRAVRAANKQREETKEPPLPEWSPNQLRHSAATEARERCGLEVAQALLGHARMDVTQVYAERLFGLARDAAFRFG